MRVVGWCLVMAAGLLAVTPAWAQGGGGRPVVAVFGLANSGVPLSGAVVERLTPYMANRLVALGRYKAVPDADLKVALSQQTRESYKECYAEACQIEVGKELAASKVLSGELSKFGRQCIVTLTLIDLRESTKEAAGSGRGACSEEGVLGSLDKAMAELLGRARSASGASTATDQIPERIPETVAPDYGDPDEEIRQAARRAARAAAERKARELAANRDWDRIQRWVTNDRLSVERRVGILKKHLSAFKQDNPHATEAQALIAQLESAEGMVRVPGGPFFMGCNEAVDTECDEDEKPGRTVSVEAFRIDKTEVTVAAYKSCVDAGDCKRDTFRTKSDNKYCNWGYSDRGQHPMNCVSWFGADAYCRLQGQRLPTEAEWEKAARGTDKRKYPWGNERASCARAVFDDGSTTATAGSETDGCGRDSTWPVGSKAQGASPYGVLDMAGNVWEWTADWYVYGDINRGKFRSLRGGSWLFKPGLVRASNRLRNSPSSQTINVGFRCVQ